MSRTQEVLVETQKRQEAQQQANDGGALVLVDASDDGWSDAAAEADARWIQGTLVLFADWQWTQGSEKTLMEKGRKLLAVGVRSVQVRWENGKPVEYRTALPGHHLLPSRESLGYLNKAEWEIDTRGDAKDRGRTPGMSICSTRRRRRCGHSPRTRSAVAAALKT
jgi:hypothetical protein